MEVQERPVVKREMVLMPQRMGLAETLRQDFVVDAEEGTTLEDIQKPGYWAHVAQQHSLQKFDQIQVRDETGRWIAEYFVLDAGRNWAKVFLKKLYEFDSIPQEPVSTTHEVSFMGNHHKWGVKRLSDNAVLQKGFTDRSGADAWLKNHLAMT